MMRSYWNDSSDRDKEAYARLDVLNYLQSIDEDGYSQVMSAWDESVMEVGDDFYNNAEAMSDHSYNEEMYSEVSYFGTELLTNIKNTIGLDDAIRYAVAEYDHYFEDLLAESVQGGSGESGEVMVASYWGLEYDDLDADYINSILDYCEYCGWYMRHDHLNFGDVVYCDQCEDEYKEEYGDDEDE